MAGGDQLQEKVMQQNYQSLIYKENADNNL
jgi:hypothetical protein